MATTTTAKILIAKRKQLKKQLDKFTEKINKQHADIWRKYLNDNISIKVGKVYERAEASRNKYKRFVVYSLKPFYLGNKVGVVAGGWWLNKDNVPEKWGSLMISGCLSPVKLVLSKDQTNKSYQNNKIHKK